MSATRTLRKRAPVDYSLKITKKERYNYVKKSDKKAKKRKSKVLSFDSPRRLFAC
jgi:hypothetical protein